MLAAAAVLPAQNVDPAPLVPADPLVPDYQPVTNAQRWDHYWNGTLLSSSLYAATLGSALWDHLDHDPPEWRQGLKGYGRRSVSEYGFHVVQVSVHQAGATALGYDPRYQHCDCKGFFRRTAHSVKWSFLTRNNAGQTRFDVPALAGAYGAGMLSMYWYPNRYNALTDGVREGNHEVGLMVGVNFFREFGPELKRSFRIGN